MKIPRETLVWAAMILSMAALLYVTILLIPKDTPPDPVVLQMETRHELYHISGQYRVIIRINGEYRGSLMMSRHELKLPHEVVTDYLVDLEYANYMQLKTQPAKIADKQR